jgi:H2-forming N5,N10-methylenetetrahydromethanopterin dehydrogenase-like enzyme
VDAHFDPFGDIVSVPLEMVLVSVQDGCTVCARCTIGSVIILDEHDGTLR